MHRRGEDLLLRDQGRQRGQSVGYSIDTRMKASLVVSAMRSLITCREPTGTVVH
jgi:hypothetical protein